MNLPTNCKFHKEYVTKDNIKSILEKYNIPKDLDLLSIDIDGNDCKVPYYSKYTGMISMMNSKQNFYMTNKKKLDEYLSIMKSSNII